MATWNTRLRFLTVEDRALAAKIAAETNESVGEIELALANQRDHEQSMARYGIKAKSEAKSE